uniref:GAF domain-containing sensor histidine kinase n=1 Tax=Mycolicibacterium sp. TUM20985 TaxID=3023370 RepID=UPI0025734804|nr:GAF domain-containing sensor histidine kinase [Mycolicibacterium sp. TUM20985]
MHEDLDELLASRDQMERLLQIFLEIGADLDLEATLSRIVTAAIELTGAEFGALGVRAPDGTLSSFVHSGMDAPTVAKIGHLPAGKGVLGLLLDTTDVIRLNDLTAHPTAVGLPEHHPPMAGFLGVPIIIRGDAFGSLYLTHSDPARVFDESDEVAARALATAAAVAIQNASLFERVRASAKWMQASREITTALLSGTESSVRPMWLIAERARELAKAEQAIVLVAADPDAPREEVTTLVVSTAVGVHADDVIGRQVPVEGSTTGAVFTSGRAVITDRFRHPIHSFTDVGERPAIVMPLRYEDDVIGVIAVARHESQPPFDSGELALIGDFAHHAAVALTLAAAGERIHELSIVADRERIAHDLHDHVIQRLFATGMHLQGTIARSHSPEVVERLNRTLDDLQATIEDIRTTIFGLQSPVRGKGFRQRVQHLFAGLTEDLATETRLHLSGPLTVVDGSLAEHAEAVLTELISNAVRHSGAGLITVDVAIADELVIQVIDDGHGIPADNQRHSGLSNVERRAEQAGGRCEVSSTAGLGTSVTWRAPLTGY